MSRFLSKFLDVLSSFFAHRKGLLLIIGVFLILTNLLLRLFSSGWLASTDLLLHIGIVIALIGVLLAWAL